MYFNYAIDVGDFLGVGAGAANDASPRLLRMGGMTPSSLRSLGVSDNIAPRGAAAACCFAGDDDEVAPGACRSMLRCYGWGLFLRGGQSGVNRRPTGASRCGGGLPGAPAPTASADRLLVNRHPVGCGWRLPVKVAVCPVRLRLWLRRTGLLVNRHPVGCGWRLQVWLRPRCACAYGFGGPGYS